MSQDLYDFCIPENLRDNSVVVPEGLKDWPKEPVTLLIPKNANYLFVNPLEEEEEFLGCQDNSDKQQLTYYNQDGKPIGSQDLESSVLTSRLIFRLEKIFQKLY